VWYGGFVDRKTFFIDLDGTLLTKDKRVTDRTRGALDKVLKAGHKLVICTGRCVGWFPRFVPDTSIRYVIGSNGAHIYDLKEKKSIYQNPIDTDKLIEVIRAATRPGVYFHFSADDNAFATEHTRDDISTFRYTTYIGDENLEEW